MSTARAQQGFTLIEIIVALALMTLIATILLTSIQLGAHSWRRVNRVAEAADSVARTQNILRIYLSAASPDDQDTTHPRVGFESDGASIDYSSLSPQAIGDGLTRYRIDQSGTDGDLTVHSRANASDGTRWSSEALLRHVAAFKVRFWQHSPGTAGEWVTRWNNQTTVPRLIEVVVAFESGDPRRWPPLYIETRVNANAACRFDVISRSCRDDS